MAVYNIQSMIHENRGYLELVNYVFRNYVHEVSCHENGVFIACVFSCDSVDIMWLLFNTYGISISLSKRSLVFNYPLPKCIHVESEGSGLI